MSTGYVCECCRAKAIRTARASLDVLEDVDVSKATSEIAAEELNRALDLLRRAPALCADGGARR
jgi:hypothetical protein